MGRADHLLDELTLQTRQGLAVPQAIGSVPELVAFANRLEGIERRELRIEHQTVLAERFEPVPLPPGGLELINADLPNVKECLEALRRWVVELERAVLRPVRESVDSPGPEWSLELLERWHIEKVLGYCRGDVAAAAARLGLSRSALTHRLNKWGLTAANFAGS